MGFRGAPSAGDSWYVSPVLVIGLVDIHYFLADDCQLLLWDLANYTQPGASPRSAGSRLNSPRPDVKKRIVTEPYMAYTAPSQITNLAWSPLIKGMSMNSGFSTVTGEWVAIASGKSIRALKV